MSQGSTRIFSQVRTIPLHGLVTPSFGTQAMQIGEHIDSSLPLVRCLLSMLCVFPLPLGRFRNAGGREDWAVQCCCGLCSDHSISLKSSLNI